MPKVFLTRPGHKDLEALEAQVRERVTEKLREVQEGSTRHLRRLTGHDLYVLRVGDHRIVLDWDRAESEIFVHAIGHRRNIYDRAL